MECQKPRLVVSMDGGLYVAQFITSKDVKAFREAFPEDRTFTDDERGSSIFGNIGMAKVLLADSWNIADLPQLYDANRTYDINALNGQDGGAGVSTRGCYSDARFVIRARNGETEHILKQVGDKKLTEEGRDGCLKTPIAFQLAGLERTPNGPLQGYTIKLTPQAKFVAAPMYSSGFSGRFSFFDSDGNPVVSNDGKYTIYNNNKPVVRVYACGGLVLCAGLDYLRDSGGGGRVVKYRAVGTEKNLAAVLAEERNANFEGLVEEVRKTHAEELDRLQKFRITFTHK